MAGYIPRWFTCQPTVTKPSSSRAQCPLTKLIEAYASSSTLSRHHSSVFSSEKNGKLKFVQFRPGRSGTPVKETRDALRINT